MKKIWFLSVTLLMMAIANTQATAAGSTINIRGTLILASNQSEGIDSSLRPYERQLRRLNFSSYKVIGNGGTRMNMPGNGVIQLSGGFTVELSANADAGNRTPIGINWRQGKKTLIRTSGPLPLVLGGPSHRDGILILILDGK